MARSCTNDLTRWLGARASRRVALTATLSSLAAGSIGRSTVRAAAVDATPVASPGVAEDWSAVQQIIRDAEATGGTVGVAVRDTRGELFSHHGDRRFHAASTIKIPILIEAYRQIEEGTLSLDDPYILQDADRVPGSGVLSGLQAGIELTLGDLLFLMITVSDNTATNRVIDAVGGLEAVNTTMQALGMTGSVLGRPMLGRLPAAGDPENWATPSDMALAVAAIVTGEAVDPESREQMLAMLEQQEVRRISRFLPEDGSLRWGNKPGDLPGVVNNVGFVTSERGTLCIAVSCEDLVNFDEAERTIGLIAQAALAVTGIAPVST